MNDNLEKYRRSLESAWGYNDYNDWPIKFNSIMHLFIKEFADEFVSDLEKCRKEYSTFTIANPFNNPSRIYRIIHSVLCGMKRSHRNIEQQRNIANYMLELTACLKIGSPFNEDGRNLILDNIDDLFINKSISECEKNKIAQICSILWSYSESIFFRAHDITKEFHGLYKRSDGKQLLIRDYFNLYPYQIWSNIPLLPINSIRIISMYPPNLYLKIDTYDHLFLEQGNLKNDMIGYRIIIDNKDITLESGLSIVEKSLESIREISKWSKHEKYPEIIKKYAEIYWFRKKPLCDLLKKDWHVPEAVYKKIDNGTPDIRFSNELSAREIQFFINTIF